MNEWCRENHGESGLTDENDSLNRFLIRFSIFTFKVYNCIILKDIKENQTMVSSTTNLRSKTRRIFIVPFCNSLKCSRRLSIFFPKFCNNIITFTHLNSFTKCLAEFKNFIFQNVISSINEFALKRFYFIAKYI